MSWDTGVNAMERKNIKFIEVRCDWVFLREELIQGSDPILGVYCLCACKKVLFWKKM